MKKKDIRDLKSVTIPDLNKKEKETKKELANIKMELKMSRVKNVHEYRAKRKDLARIMTIKKLLTFTEESKKQIKK